MLQLPETRTAEISAVVTGAAVDSLPADIRSLIALHRTAIAAADAATNDTELNAATDTAIPIYAALLKAQGTSLACEVERLLYVAAYCKALGITGELDGYFDLPDLTLVAKNMARLSAPAGPSALKVINKKVQSLAKYPAPSLQKELDRLASANDVRGMIALYDYCVTLAEANTDAANRPRAGSIDDFLDAESIHLWAKAYAVADRLKSLTPSSDNRDYLAQTLFNAALQMGNTLPAAIAVAQHINGTRE